MLTDSDLLSVQEARDLATRSARAADAMRRLGQAEVDRIGAAVAAAGVQHAERLGQLAFEETGFGDPASKTRKNRFACEQVWESIRDLQTVGVVHSDPQRRLYEIAEPYGVILAVVPVTNPTSTALFKILISLKTRNSIVLSPHPRAVRCISESARIAAEAATRAGAPADAVTCMVQPTLEGTQAAMSHPDVALILATGGPGLVRAAYSSGKPAIGVGPGNVPAYIEQTADIEHAVEAVVQSQCFDNGTLCCSEQALVVDRVVKDAVTQAFAARDAHWCSDAERESLARLVVQGRALNPAIVGLYPHQIASMAGFEVPVNTTVLLTEEHGVGWEHPLSVEKLAPILAVYTVDDWREGCDRCIEILNFGGRGHTLVIHSENEDIIWAYAHDKPTHRILVNGPASHGAVGYSSPLTPSMTLGCGAFGGNITSDNISAEHLMLRKRVAWVQEGFVEAEAVRRRGATAARVAAAAAAGAGGRMAPAFSGSSGAFVSWPSPPRRPS